MGKKASERNFSMYAAATTPNKPRSANRVTRVAKPTSGSAPAATAAGGNAKPVGGGGDGTAASAAAKSANIQAETKAAADAAEAAKVIATQQAAIQEAIAKLTQRDQAGSAEQKHLVELFQAQETRLQVQEAALASEKIALIEQRNALASDRAAIAQDRRDIGQDRRELVLDRQAFTQEKEQIRAAHQRQLDKQEADAKEKSELQSSAGWLMGATVAIPILSITTAALAASTSGLSLATFGPHMIWISPVSLLFKGIGEKFYNSSFVAGYMRCLRLRKPNNEVAVAGPSSAYSVGAEVRSAIEMAAPAAVGRIPVAAASSPLDSVAVNVRAEEDQLPGSVSATPEPTVLGGGGGGAAIVARIAASTVAATMGTAQAAVPGTPPTSALAELASTMVNPIPTMLIGAATAPARLTARTIAEATTAAAADSQTQHTRSLTSSPSTSIAVPVTTPPPANLSTYGTAGTATVSAAAAVEIPRQQTLLVSPTAQQAGAAVLRATTATDAGSMASATAGGVTANARPHSSSGASISKKPILLPA